MLRYPDRRRPKRWLAIGWFAMALAAPAGADQPGKTIVFGSDDDFPPYEFLDGKGEPRGFTVDLVRAVGEAVGHDVEVRLGPWPEIRAQLEQSAGVDVADMYESPDRRDRFDFSNPIQVATDELFVRGDEPDACSVTDLDGRRVLVQDRSFAAETLARSHPAAIAQRVPSEPEALRRLSAGEGDCAIASTQTGRYVVRDSRLTNLRVTGPPFNPRNHCFAVKRGNAELLADLNRGLAIVKATGRYGEISKRWLSVSTSTTDATAVLRTVALIVAPLGLLIGAALLWSWSLRRRVRERTRELAEELLERRRVVDALRESEQRLRTLIEHAPEAIFVVDTQAQIVEQINDKACSLLGVEPQQELALGDLLGSGSRSVFDGAFERVSGGEDVAFEHTVETTSGAMIPCEVRLVQLPSSSRRLVRVSLNDIRERKSREQRAIQSQRMEALGQLSGGIAHDFNNILGVIAAHGELLKMEHGQSAKTIESVDEILAAGERAAGLTRQLLAFGRRQLADPTVLSVNDLLERMQKLLRRLLGEDIELVVDLADDAADVRADPSQLEQVVLNLVVNGRDAMPDGGALTLRTRHVHRGGVGDAAAPAGDWTVIEVADTGTGIPPELHAKLFEPFFTTKEAIGGTGLGLATVYGIVESAGGKVTLETEVGRGSTFRVWLPRTLDPPAPRATAAIGPPPRGSGLVLLVEDEAPLRRAVHRLLAQSGYEVVPASDAAEALRRFDSLVRKPDVLVTDVVMPAVSGRELAEKLRERQPDIPVVFMTGYAGDVLLRRGDLPGRSKLITKPFRNDELLGALTQLLQVAEIQLEHAPSALNDT